MSKQNRYTVSTPEDNQGTSPTLTKEELKAQEILAKAEEKQKNKGNVIEDAKKEKKGPIGFINGTVTELKKATWPTKGELVKWCFIVAVTVAVFAILAFLIDSFIATPLMYIISDFRLGNDTLGIFDIILCVIFFLSGIGSIFGVYLHSGGETEGLSDTVASKLTGGSGQAQKNLDRLTMICIIVFVLCLIGMMIIFPSGSISS